MLILFWINRTLCSVCFLFLVTACSYKSYDSTKPDAYAEYWCVPKNINRSLPNILADNKDTFEAIVRNVCNNFNN